MSDFVWENPPPQPPPSERSKRNSDPWIDGVVDELRRHPGRWARVATAIRSANGGVERAWSRRGCQVTIAAVDDGYGWTRADLYVRWPVDGSGSMTDPRLVAD